MEIERINENTVKFFISYVDVEERGFDREEIWYNREKSEELFWEMMDEVHEAEGFVFDGPLWIQVQALEKGLEILVTKAQITKDGSRFELPIPDDKLKHLSVNEHIEEFLDAHFQNNETDSDDYEEESFSFVAYFEQFEDLVSLSKRFLPEFTHTELYSLDDKYYLYTEFSYQDFTEEEIDNWISVILEYADESQRTIDYIHEYGKLVMEKSVFATIQEYFH